MTIIEPKDGDYLTWKRIDGSIAVYKFYLGSLIQCKALPQNTIESRGTSWSQ